MTAILALAAVLEVLLAVTGALTVAWLLSPASPSPLIAACWHRLIVVTMMPAPGVVRAR